MSMSSVGSTTRTSPVAARGTGPTVPRHAARGTKSAAAILVDRFESLIFLLLAAAASTSFVVSEAVQGAAILFAILTNAAIGFVTEWRAVRSMEALRRLQRLEVRVRRGAETRTVAADDLVPGDIVPLDAGDVIPADRRLIETKKLRSDESRLTGEAVPVDKSSEPLEHDVPLVQRRNMALKGSYVTQGSGLGVVTGTARSTELARIATQAEEAEVATVPPPDPETLDCDYAARGSLSIWSRRNWAGERCPCRSISQFSL